MTRSARNAGLLAELGAQPVVCDVFDADALTRALVSFAPDVVFHQLTDLPDDAGRAGYEDPHDTEPRQTDRFSHRQRPGERRCTIIEAIGG